MKKTIISAAFLISAISTTHHAYAFTDTIDFDGLAGTYIPGEHGHEMTKDGGHTFFLNNERGLINGFFIGVYGIPFHFPDEFPAPPGMRVDGLFWHNLGKEDAGRFAYNGTDYVTFSPAIEISRSDNDLFSVSSIDLYPWLDGIHGTEAIAKGIFPDGSVITQSISFGSAIGNGNMDNQSGNDFSTVELIGFTNIVDLKIENTLFSTHPYYVLALDNINVSYDTPINIPDIPAIPEPSTYALLLAGLGLFGFIGMRNTSEHDAPKPTKREPIREEKRKKPQQ